MNHLKKTVVLITTSGLSPGLFPEIRNTQSFFKHQSLFTCKLFPMSNLSNALIHSEDKSASALINLVGCISNVMNSTKGLKINQGYFVRPTI